MMNIINYQLNNTLLFILVSYYREVDWVAQQATDHSYLPGTVEAVSNFRKFAGKYLWWSLFKVTF